MRANILGQKLVQLTMPGVPDVFQGCEIGRLAVVDPDNRRPVDWTDRALRLSRVLDDEPCFDLDDDKIRVTALALRTGASTRRRSSALTPPTPGCPRPPITPSPSPGATPRAPTPSPS